MTSKPTKGGYAALKKLALATQSSADSRLAGKPQVQQKQAPGAIPGASGRAKAGTRTDSPTGRSYERGPAALHESAERQPVQMLVVEEAFAGQRIDNFLVRELKGAPKSLIYRICRSGEVRANSKRVKPDYRLVAGDKIRVPPLRLGEKAAFVPADERITWLREHILHEDKELLVLNKPSGLASHGGSGLSFGAIEAMRALKPLDRLELVHRLDRDTSGILLMSKRRTALKFLQTGMRDGQITKRYFALLAGAPKKDKFDVKASLLKNELASGERFVKVDDDGKPSLTHFKVLERFGDFTLVEATLGTGRTHQIRVHAQTVGHSVAGDDKYGDAGANAQAKALGLGRLFLHAAHIAWKSADGNRSYEAPLPAELEKMLQRLRAISSP
jgi:23S rRNA pseudouridine955/2504/2580 synthase